MNYKIIGKYIKNLNFSIPNAKAFFLLSKNITNYKINIDIKSSQIEQNIIEVDTSLNLSPTKQIFDKMDTKVVLSTLVQLLDNKIEKEKIEKIILIEVPSQIYGELRKIFVDLFENSGFKDIKISDNVDFQKLYNLRKVQ
tara:strand:+ start:2179 stop:2598 length:420 start_codon:yes stop_codon:yes gene_type:complete